MVRRSLVQEFSLETLLPSFSLPHFGTQVSEFEGVAVIIWGIHADGYLLMSGVVHGEHLPSVS